MKRFARLYTVIDQTTKTSGKVSALAEYFSIAPATDAAWAIHFLSGGKIARPVPTSSLRSWACEAANIEPMMFDECYEIVGDLAELMALILPPPKHQTDLSLSQWITDRLIPLRDASDVKRRESLLQFWDELEESERFVMHKLLTGSFRVGVSKGLVIQALSKSSNVSPEILSHRLMGNWQPTADSYKRLFDPDINDALPSQPYPFCLAHPLEANIESLGEVTQWCAEWKWDGIRAQIVKRNDKLFIWSRGEDLMTDRFPELTALSPMLTNGTVLDGEIVAFKNGAILPFSEMQRRIGRKTLGKKILADVPVAFIAFDLIESNGIDLREVPWMQRRKALEQSIAPLHSSPNSPFQLSELITATSWTELAALRDACREKMAEGLMLKRSDSRYRVGRARGEWWKWKIEPYTIDAVLVYAQRGHGKRASLYTDYTFAVWNGVQLVPFAKAYSGLTDAEINRVDQFVRRNTLERFGPVHSVTPQLVFELAFENIQLSTRHKSGVAVRFPRIVRWREDLSIKDADSLDTIKQMMTQTANPGSTGGAKLDIPPSTSPA
jgi:DNA ligase 1